MKLSTVAQMRSFDVMAIQDFSIPEIVLMENAGVAAVQVLKSHVSLTGKRILVVCGPGNNGGDGLVVARQLASYHADVSVLFLNPPETYRGVSRENFDMICKIGIPFWTASNDIEQALTRLRESDLIVDAIFGTGLSREPENSYAQFIAAINASNKPVLSLDIPSGVNGDTGSVPGEAIQATWTVTFGLPKIGNLLFPGYRYVGKLFVSSISFPKQITSHQDLFCEINLPPPCPKRNETGHKGTFGQALFIAGAASYYGAPYLSAYAFLKSGGGYSRLAAPLSVIKQIAAKSSELVFLPQKETTNGSLSLENLDALSEIANHQDFVVLGPGVSLESETQELIRKLFLTIEKPVLLDGDGITALSSEMGLLDKRKAPTILTPHIGEMARVLHLAAKDLPDNLPQLVRDFCRRWNVTLVLKGAHSIIGKSDGNLFVNMSGNSGMATAGSGDVLTGVIAAMYGLGMKLDDAVCKGVFMHGFAGDLAAKTVGEDGMTAGDILKYLPIAMKYDRKGEIFSRFPQYSGAISI